MITQKTYPKSLALYQELATLTPTGSHTLSKNPHRFPFGAYPPLLVEGEGVRVWDADDHEFLDLICSLGATTLGYGGFARRSQPSFSLPSRDQLELARLVTQTFHAEAVRFLTTGSDACSYAVRCARAYTGRDVLLVADNGYHGTHDWFTVLRDEHPGVPDIVASSVYTFPYNSLKALDLFLPILKPALVMLEPCLFTEPSDGFLPGVIERAHEHGALVCFDETILGGRMHLLGGSGYWHLQPDLRVYGKALAAGEACAFVVGPHAVLAAGVGYSGTFLGNGTGLEGLRHGLTRYLTEPALITNQWDYGTRIQRALRDAADVNDLDVVVDGYPWHPRLTFTGSLERRQMSVFLQEAADRDVLWADAGVNVPATMSEADCSQVCQALRGAMDAVAEGAQLRGADIERGFQVRKAAA